MFKKFNSIENSYRKEQIAEVEKADLKRVNKGFGRVAADLVRVRLLQ